MSIDNIQKFQDRVAAEPDLQSRIASIHQGIVREAAEKVAALSVELGIPFTAEEFLAAQSSAAGELSEQDLDAVAGGMRINPFFHPDLFRFS